MAELNGIIEQLGLDHTFYFQFALFAVLFFVMGPLYFSPFLSLIELRQMRTVKDREAARKIAAQADEKLQAYRDTIRVGRVSAQQTYDEAVVRARKEEAALLLGARTEAKKIMQDALDSVARQRDVIRVQMEVEISSFAKAISDRLLSGKS